MSEDNHEMQKYLSLLFREKKSEEFIKISTRHRYIKTFANHYFKTIEEAESFIDSNKGIYDVYVGLATTIKESGEEEYLGSRNCLAFDFDAKDYPDNRLTHRDIIDKFKSIGLFYHLIIDSGHGFHVYVFCERTTDISRITGINKQIAQSLGADIKSTLPTQILRVPETFNYKDSKVKKVNVIHLNKKIRYYTLEELERRFARSPNYYNDTKERKLPNLKSDMNCISEMLKGVPEGHRNTALGRITKYYQQKGFTEPNVKDIVREWNNRCTPPKDFKEVERDFQCYWNTDYKLLGCNFTDARMQCIMSSYCDKYKCKYHIIGSMRIDKITEKEYVIDNNYLEDRIMRKLSGNDYLVFGILLTNEIGLNTNQLIEKLTSRRTNKCCISKPTLYKVLDNLWKKGFIDCIEGKKNNKPNFYKAKQVKNYGKGYTRLLYSACILMINKCITQNEYLVYIYLSRNLQKAKSITYDDIANALDMDKSNICKYVTGLEMSGLLHIDKVVNDKGVTCNRYTIMG